MTEPTNDQLLAYSLTNQKVLDAETKIREGIEDYRKAIANRFAVEHRINPKTIADKLIAYAFSNRAGWSGGATSPSNVIETIIREEALHYLNCCLSHTTK